MFETPASHLAVAMLTESGAGGAAYRQEMNQPIQGYCLVRGDGRNGRISIYLENGRTLTSRSNADSFYYEGWLTGGERPISLGAFNTTHSGEGSFTCVREASQFDFAQVTGVRVTAEPFGGSVVGARPVLEGRLVWLNGEAPAPAESVHESVHALVAPLTEEVITREGVVSGHSTKDPSMEETMPEMETDEREASSNLVEDDQDLDVVPEPQVIEPSPHEPVSPESAVPVSAPPPMTHQLVLASRHPMAPRAAGMAALDVQSGLMTISMRGLPSPHTLGQDPQTERPYNSYRVWLLNQRVGTRQPIGLVSRVWGENFRFQVQVSEPLTRYDAILVLADDRSAPGPNPSAPVILFGSYGDM